MELTAQFASRLLSCTPKLLNNPLETSRLLALSTTTTLRNQKRSGPPQLEIVNARRESGGGGAKVDTIVAVKEKPKSEQFEVYRGSPTPFGATARDGGVNFAIFSANAVSTTLYFISLSDLHEVSEFAFFSFLFSLFGGQCIFTTVLKTGPDRPVRPVQPGTGSQSGPVKTPKTGQKPGLNRKF